VLQFFFFCRWR